MGKTDTRPHAGASPLASPPWGRGRRWTEGQRELGTTRKRSAESRASGGLSTRRFRSTEEGGRQHSPARLPFANGGLRPSPLEPGLALASGKWQKTRGFSLQLLRGGRLGPRGMRDHVEQRPALPAEAPWPTRPPARSVRPRSYLTLQPPADLPADHRHMGETSREQLSRPGPEQPRRSMQVGAQKYGRRFKPLNAKVAC